MLRTLFLQAPSFDGFDGGAGARYQMKREVRSFWYPTWLAQPAAMIEGSKLIDAPPHDLKLEDVLPEVRRLVEDCVARRSRIVAVPQPARRLVGAAGRQSHLIERRSP